MWTRELDARQSQQGVVIVLVILTPSPILADPPFEGSVFITPVHHHEEGDPSRLTGVTYTGRGSADDIRFARRTLD